MRLDLNFSEPGFRPAPAPLSKGGGAMCKGCVFVGYSWECALQKARGLPNRSTLSCRELSRPDKREIIFERWPE